MLLGLGVLLYCLVNSHSIFKSEILFRFHILNRNNSIRIWAICIYIIKLIYWFSSKKSRKKILSMKIRKSMFFQFFFAFLFIFQTNSMSLTMRNLSNVINEQFEDKLDTNMYFYYNYKNQLENKQQCKASDGPRGKSLNKKSIFSK